MSSVKNQLIRVGELAMRTGKSTRAIRFYEERGLLFPQSRTTSGYRLYTPDSVKRIQWIDQMQSMGLSISEIADVLGSLRDHETGPLFMTAIRRFYRERLDRTQNEIARLMNLSKQLQSTLTFLDECVGCQSERSPNDCINCQERQSMQQMPSMVAALVE